MVSLTLFGDGEAEFSVEWFDRDQDKRMLEKRKNWANGKTIMILVPWLDLFRKQAAAD